MSLTLSCDLLQYTLTTHITGTCRKLHTSTNDCLEPQMIFHLRDRVFQLRPWQTPGLPCALTWSRPSSCPALLRRLHSAYRTDVYPAPLCLCSPSCRPWSFVRWGYITPDNTVQTHRHTRCSITVFICCSVETVSLPMNHSCEHCNKLVQQLLCD